MYRPAHFQENDPRRWPRSWIPILWRGAGGCAANRDCGESHSTAPAARCGRSHAPAARARSRGQYFWKITPAESPVLAIFGGPDRYISPAWYPTKAETGEVGPTWNYLVVHAHGRITFTQDTAWAADTRRGVHQSPRGDPPAAVEVSDAPTSTAIACCGPSSGSRSSSRNWKGNQGEPEPQRARARRERGPVSPRTAIRRSLSRRSCARVRHRSRSASIGSPGDVRVDRRFLGDITIAGRFLRASAAALTVEQAAEGVSIPK